VYLRELRDEEGSLQVHCHHCRPVGGGHLDSRLSRVTPALLTRMCRPPNSGDGAVHRRLDVRAVGHVGRDGYRPAAPLADRRGCLLCGLLVEVNDRDRRAVGGEPPAIAAPIRYPPPVTSATPSRTPRHVRVPFRAGRFRGTPVTVLRNGR